MSVMIETQNLGRYFGDIKAVDGITFSAQKGEVLGFLGPNGAGKSTTMKMLTGFLTPSFGTARVAGYDIIQQATEVRKSLGYLPENAPLYGEMEVHEFLNFIAEVREIEKQKRSSAIERVVNLTHLEGVIYQQIETLSKGFKRRVGLAQALIHDPQILILDEPTDGLDPNQKFEVRKLIQQMAKDKCILLSTHILEEVSEVCSRAVIIAKGTLVADDTPEGLRRKSSIYGAITLGLNNATEGEVLQTLKSVSGIQRVEESRDNEGLKQYTLYVKDAGATVPPLIKTIEERGWQLRTIRVEPGQLDEVFREVTQ